MKRAAGHGALFERAIHLQKIHASCPRSDRRLVFIDLHQRFSKTSFLIVGPEVLYGSRA